MVSKGYLELKESLSSIIENDLEIIRLLQNCRIVLRGQADTITYSCQGSEIRIDKVMAWIILLILEKLEIEDIRKRAALDSILDDLRLKERKN